MRWHTLLLLAAACTAPATSPARRSGPPRALHGGFSGEVKPVLYVRNVEESARFFQDVLGFELLGFAGEKGAPYYADLAAGRLKFGLHEPTSAADEGRVGPQKIYFRVEDVDAHRQRVKAWGAAPGPLRETEWMTMFTVVDPDGHDVVFAQTDPERHSIDPW